MTTSPHPISTGTATRTAVVNVRVFDGRQVGERGTVVIDGGTIGADASGARTVDGRGGVLLPGLIDAHVHLSGLASIQSLADFGVTTALDMGTSWDLVHSLRQLPGLTDIRSGGNPAVAPGSAHSRIPGAPPEAEVSGPAQADAFVTDWVARGADYIKIIVSRPGFDQATLDALVAAAHHHGKITIAHASTFDDVAMAQEARVDVVTHAPLDRAVDPAGVERMATEHRISVPTLTMMEGIVEQTRRPGAAYEPARASVTALHDAGVTILAGTDANDAKGVPANIPHGESLHHELELLVDAGLKPVEALRAATSEPARYFALRDRGSVRPGLRADLLLVDGDPTVDISATRNIQRVWCAGVERHIG